MKSITPLRASVRGCFLACVVALALANAQIAMGQTIPSPNLNVSNFGSGTLPLGRTPAYTGDTTKAAGTGVTVTNTVKGKTVLPIDGSIIMDVSGMRAQTPGNTASGATIGGAAGPASLATLFNATYAFGSASDTPNAVYPTPQMQVVPNASPFLTDVGAYAQIFDKANEATRVAGLAWRPQATPATTRASPAVSASQH